MSCNPLCWLIRFNIAFVTGLSVALRSMALRDANTMGYQTYRLLETILANQSRMISMLQQLVKMENKMSIDLTTITAEVAKNTDVTSSVVTLVNNLAAQIAAIPPSTDPVTQAALDQLTSTLTNNDQAIGTAVAANTPASPPSQMRR